MIFEKSIKSCSSGFPKALSSPQITFYGTTEQAVMDHIPKLLTKLKLIHRHQSPLPSPPINWIGVVPKPLLYFYLYRAVWYDRAHFQASWRLDPTEGPSRVRCRLQRCHMDIADKYIMEEYRKDSKLRVGRSVARMFLYETCFFSVCKNNCFM